MVDPGDTSANCSSFYGQRKAVQWRYCCNSAVQHSQSSVRVELGSSFAVVHLECGSSSCTDGKFSKFIPFRLLPVYYYCCIMRKKGFLMK